MARVASLNSKTVVVTVRLSPAEAEMLDRLRVRDGVHWARSAYLRMLIVRTGRVLTEGGVVPRIDL